jgi:hypothetical protein
LIKGLYFLSKGFSFCGANMKFRKIVRIIHRDFGYLVAGLTVIYGISGIAVNHVDEWNPNYNIEKKTVEITPLSDSNLTTSSLILHVIKELNEKDSIISSFRSAPLTVDIFFDGKSISANFKKGKAIIETVESRSIIRETNFLHLNAPKKMWTYVADGFALMLIFLAITGMFMIKGKKGIRGRGKYLIIIGIFIPIIFLLIYF